MLLFALKTLIFDCGKLLLALLGVVFSMVLINLQVGLFLGLTRKGSLLIDNIPADIWVGPRGVENIGFPYDLPEVWVQRVRGLDGVEAAEPMRDESRFPHLDVVEVEGRTQIGRLASRPLAAIVQTPLEVLSQFFQLRQFVAR